MSTLASFDTLAYAKRLKEADVPEKQAEAQAEALREALNTSLNEHASALASKGDIALLHKELHKEIALVRKEIEALENRLTIKLSVVMTGLIAFAGAVLAFVSKF